MRVVVGPGRFRNSLDRAGCSAAAIVSPPPGV